MLFEMRLLNLSINFVLILVVFVVFLTTFRPNLTTDRLRVINLENYKNYQDMYKSRQ